MIGKISTKISDFGQKVAKKVAQNPLKLSPSFKKAHLLDSFVRNTKTNDISFEAFLDTFELAQIQEATKNYTPIEFEPAKTLREAHKMARILGVKHFKMGENDRLEVWNYLNEGFIKYKNAHLGLDYTPKKVHFVSGESTTRMAANKWLDMFFIYDCFYGVNKINGAIQEKLDNVISAFCDEVPEGIKIPKFFAKEDEIKYAQNLIRKFQNAKELNYGDKVELLTILHTMQEVIETFVFNPKVLAQRLFALDNFMPKCNWEKKEKYLFEILNCENNTQALEKMGKILGDENETLRVQLSNKKFTTLFHEMGHLQDWAMDRAPASVKFESEAQYPSELREWLNDKKCQKIAYLISNYATTGPGEFIAETYAKLLSGDSVPKEALELYQKMNGPKIPYII